MSWNGQYPIQFWPISSPGLSDVLSQTEIEWANIQENFCFIYILAVTYSVLLHYTSDLEENATFICWFCCTANYIRHNTHPQERQEM